MRKKALAIAGIVTAVVLAGGWALAQSRPHGPGFGPPFMHGADSHGTGPGMHGRAGMMGHGMMGMNRGSATATEHNNIHDLVFNHYRIKRTVVNLPDGIRTITESDDNRIADVIKKHVAEMGKRVEEGRDPGLPVESPALRAIFRDRDKVKSTYEEIEKGVVVVQTSTDASTIKALQEHAAEVSDLVQRGMVALHEAMMKNGGGMMPHGMQGSMVGPHHRH